MRSGQIRHPAPAFTLVELIIALSIAAIVLMAVASLIGLSTKAVPADDGVQVTAIHGGEFLSKFAADASIAREVTETTAQAVTFVIPDQNGDSAADSIRYVWTGVSGEPLARVVNGTDRLEIMSGIQAFSLSYAFADVPAYSELVKSTGPQSTFQTSLPSVVTSRDVGPAICAQVFAPILPSDAIAWSLDDLTLSLGPKGLAILSSSTLTIEIRGCDVAGNPNASVYARTSVAESSLGLLGILPSNRSFSFSGIVVPASERLCVLVSCDGTALVGTAAGVGWRAEAPALVSNNGGSTWAALGGFVFGHAASGRVTRVGGGESTRRVVSRVGVALEAGGEAWTVESGVARRNPGETP